MPTTITHSISSYVADDYLDEISLKNNTDVAERRGTNGDVKKVKAYNATNDISLKGGGNPAIAVGIGTLAYTGASGGVKLIQSYEHTEKNTDFDDYTVAAKHYPNGAAG